MPGLHAEGKIVKLKGLDENRLGSYGASYGQLDDETCPHARGAPDGDAPLMLLDYLLADGKPHTRR